MTGIKNIAMMPTKVTVTTPRMTSFSLALMMGAMAMMAVPPQIAVPIPRRRRSDDGMFDLRRRTRKKKSENPMTARLMVRPKRPTERRSPKFKRAPMRTMPSGRSFLIAKVTPTVKSFPRGRRLPRIIPRMTEIRTASSGWEPSRSWKGKKEALERRPPMIAIAMVRTSPLMRVVFF